MVTSNGYKWAPSERSAKLSSGSGYEITSAVIG